MKKSSWFFSELIVLWYYLQTSFILIRTAFFVVCFIFILELSVNAQLTGTKNIPGDYATLALAITDLNIQGVGAGGVTLNLLAGNPETAPSGGYSVTATGISTDPITIQGNGNTITASGSLTAGADNDAIFKIIGGDYITLTGFTMQENSANTTTTPVGSNNMTEWGVALLYASATDGAQNNTIQGNAISLNRTYANTFGVYSNTRHTATSVTAAADITATSGSNSNNKVYANTISNVNMGIAFIGSGTAAYQDAGNDIGGGSLATGNTITNWGGAAATTLFVSNSTTSYCILVNHQTAENVSYNTIISAVVSGAAVTFRGILKAYTFTPPVGNFTSSITNNTITLSSGFTSGTFECINSQDMTALSTATININSNTILNCVMSGAASSTTIVGIINSSAPGTLSISNNSIKGNTSTSTTGGFTGISNSGAVVTAININNNQIGNAGGGTITFSAATNTAVIGITNSNGAATATLTIQGNDIRGITHSVAGSSAHTYIINSAANPNTNINSNTFTNLNVNTTGAITFISNNVTHAANTIHNVNNNTIVTAYNKAAAGGTVYFYNANGSSGSTVTETNLGNNFSNMTFTGATLISGWRHNDGAGPRKTITNNTFNNITGGTSAITILSVAFSDATYASNNVSGNTISNITGTGAVTGIASISGVATQAGNQNFFNNNIHTLSTTGASLVVGIYIQGGNTQNIYNNKIYDLQSNNATGTVNGIQITNVALSGTMHVRDLNCYNNFIGDLRTPSANSSTGPIRGININITVAPTVTSNLNVYYNTIYLNATSTGANFSSYGIYATTNATATFSALDLRNNIIVNTSTPNGTGLTVAYRRSSTTLTNYVASSNNNLFYAGTPGASRLIFYDGTNSDQTLAAYQARVAPRDAASQTENPNFISTAGSNPSYLHIDPSIATVIESGAASIGGYTNDFDSEIRQGSAGYLGTGTAPDIGADEFGPLVISYTPLSNSYCLTSYSLSASVFSSVGVNTTAGTKPRIYYKKSGNANAFNDNTSGTDGWKYTEATNASSPFAFTLDYSLFFGGAGVSATDVIQYFVVAQDLSATPYVGINSGLFSAAPSPSDVSLTGVFPIGGTINSYTIMNGISSGTVTVGSGGNYPTLTGAGGLFAAINAAGGLFGNLLANVISNITEDGYTPLNAFVSGCAGINTQGNRA
ncbi:MAG: hypothetical protein HY840_11860 [Bacteroidetes bacterium]|nr:hypothetical protein [Bacteroidota bacterium]